MKTSKAQFNIFKREVEKWVKVLGLTDWYLDIEWENLDEETFAQCLLNYNGQSAIISLNKESCQVKINTNVIKEAAVHEVLELLLADLGALLEARDFSPDSYEKSTHKVINRLAKVLVKSNKKRLD